LRPVSREAGPDRGPNGAGGAFREAEYPRRQPGFRNFQGSGNQTGERARAILEELLEDYRDFLRVRKLAPWDKESRESRFVRRIGSQKNRSYESYATYIETRPAEIVANILICLIHQTNYLLDQQLRQLEKAFLEEGGLRERMTRARLSARSKSR
jgi:four helix bundle suffix protein